MNKTFLIGCAFLASVFLQGCTNTVKYDDKPASKTVHKEVGEGTISSSSLSMLEGMLSDSEVQNATKSGRPILAVFGLINFTSDKIDLAAVNGQLMNELNKANRFRFSDQDAMASEGQKWENNLYQLFEQPESAQDLASQVNADYLLVGEISNVIRTQPKLKQVYYRVSLKLLDKNKGSYVWQEQRELLKSEKNIVYGI